MKKDIVSLAKKIGKLADDLERSQMDLDLFEKYYDAKNVRLFWLPSSNLGRPQAYPQDIMDAHKEELDAVAKKIADAYRARLKSGVEYDKKMLNKYIKDSEE